MSRPLLEMADIVRCAGQSFIEHSRKWINWQHQKVLLAIARCRTAALGGHRDLEETTIYLHLSQRHLSATASPLDALTFTAQGEQTHSS